MLQKIPNQSDKMIAKHTKISIEIVATFQATKGHEHVQTQQVQMIVCATVSGLSQKAS